MSNLFETYYDSFGHELYIGSPVVARTSKGFIWGHVTNFYKDNKGNSKFEIIADIGRNKNVAVKKSYKIIDKNVFLINIKKK